MTAKTKILVIGSDPAMLRFLERNFGENDYLVANTLRTDEELKTLLDKEMPNLVILDVIMPDLDGIEICLRIRQWSQAPIMMLSAWGAGEDEVRGLDLSAESYLTEPFGVAEFKARLREALERDSTAVTPLVSLGLPSIEMN